MNTENVTRLEIIDYTLCKACTPATRPHCKGCGSTGVKGRTVIFWDESKKIELSLQDDGKTLKVFINERTDKMVKLSRVRQDLNSMVHNYFYEGWRYRAMKEGYDAVAKDCSISANNIITEFERLTNEVYEDTRNK